MLARIEASAAFNAFMPIDAGAGAGGGARPRKRAGGRARRSGRSTACRPPSRTISGCKGQPTRRGSRTGDVTAPAPADAPAVARLREQGAVFIGKTTLPEYGWIGVCHSPLTGITRNPWNPAHTPGGSTGGGAVAALLGLGVLHLGTDGAGVLAHSGGLHRRVRLQAELRPGAGLSAIAVQCAGAPGADRAPRRRCGADAVGDLRARRARHDGVEYAGAGFHRRAR